MTSAARSPGGASGSPDAASAARPLKHHREGTHRLIAPEETLARVRHLMPLLGITRIANVTGLDSLGIPVVTVSRPNARSVSVAQGKGLTLAAAKASGLMESIESHHAEHPHLPLLHASYHELRRSLRVVDVTRLPRSSASSFHDHLQLLWVEANDLAARTPVWVPFEVVHTNFTLPLPAGTGSFLMSSNGLASGNHLLEAVSHGICEVVERDATTLFHCGSEAAQERCRLDLSTVSDPGCREVLEKYERAGVAVGAWDVTSDVGIPAFLCTIVDRSPSPLRPLPAMNGMGCHPAREVALLRALTEAAQGRMTMITGSRDDLRHTTYAEAQDLLFLRQMGERASARAGGKPFSDVPTFQGQSFDEDVAWELQALRAVGIDQVLVVDLTRPEFGVSVVRVVIPGLESIHDVPGFLPGARARLRLQEPRA